MSAKHKLPENVNQKRSLSLFKIQYTYVCKRKGEKGTEEQNQLQLSLKFTFIFTENLKQFIYVCKRVASSQA